ncbi:high mobility group A5 [Abeliophyllum distichum]|uniref:High mobility group A5 n=1 Tax=Abeliophyllum distichum TaxID=126358 RepID=A0ABD1PCW7_9LAMI
MDPPPPTTDSASELHSAPAANPTPTKALALNHPTYAEMITAAIWALKERNGSSKRAIAKYIETQYSNLPPTHSALLTHHLKRLKNNGQLLMVKNSYKLPRSTTVPVTANGNGNSISVPASVGPKRRPGRPPKNAQAAVPNVIPVFAPEAQQAMPVTDAVPIVVPGTELNMAIGPGSVYVSIGKVNGDASGAGVGTKRGRGRPPKQGGENQGGLKQGPGRPPKSLGVQPGGVERPRGRPKNDSSATVVTGMTAYGRPKKTVAASGVAKGAGRPRGRPPKLKDVVVGVAPPAAVSGTVAPVAGGMATGATLAVGSWGVVPAARKHPGRPPKAGAEMKKSLKPHTVKPKKPRKLSGKPLGRPKKDASDTVIQAPNSQQQMAYEDLKGKLEHLQSRIKPIVSVIKPCLNTATAISALQELETLASMDVNVPTNVQGVPPQPQKSQTES